MLGLYDSGLGGLTVLAALRRAGIRQDVVYFADQAHVPYGDRSETELYGLLTENFALLDGYGVDAVVMACNTSCAVAARRGGFPPARGPVLDLIANVARALGATAFRRIAVFATAATVRSGAYARAIGAVAPHIEVCEIAAPALVPLVEAGRVGTLQAREAVRRVCDKLVGSIDAIVYGCTHYPLLDDEFAAELGPAVARIDPAVAQAAAAVALFDHAELPPQLGVTRYLTNGDVAAFEANVRRWTGESAGTFGFAEALVRAPARPAAGGSFR
jgi:glutamate racemase